MFNVSPEGQVTAIGGAGTTVNVGGGSQDKLDEEFAKLDAKSLAEVSTTGMQAIRNIGRIDHLGKILADSPQGLEGVAKLFAGEFGIDTEGLDSAQTAQAIINSLVPESRAPGSGPMSDADLVLFKQSWPRIINQPGGNEMILNTVRAIAQYDAEGAAIVQRFRAKEIDSVKAFELLQSRENPLANFKAPGATEGSGGGSTVRTWNPETQELE
jgi:flagellar protein FlgJ